MAIMLASVAWMNKGEIVNIRGVSDQYAEYESMTWIIDDAPNDGKVLLRCDSKWIRLAVDKVLPTTLQTFTASETNTVSPTTLQTIDTACETLNYQLDVPFHWKLESWIVAKLPNPIDRDADPIEKYLNQWVPLPGLGGNCILLRKCSEHRRPLLMFPRLEMLGLELCFYSEWNKGATVVIEADILKPCPAKQIWIFCAWCQKFHLPYDGPGSHRQSKKHAYARWYFDTVPAERLREQIGFQQVEGRWL